MTHREIRPLHAAIGTVSAMAIDLASGGTVSSWGAPSGEASHALLTLGLLALSVGLSILAGYLLEKNRKSPLQDERPTPLATRGSYIAWVSGIRRLGYVLTWAGDRTKRKERVSGGKGDLFAGPKQDVWVESGCHVVCVGPVDALLEIEQGGKPIFTGPITPDSHPSGTLVDLGGEGAFRIFWGEDDQPVNTYLGNASRVGVSSRWPGYCYIEWRNKRLGTSPNWPFLSYTVEKRPTGSYLSDTDPWFEPTKTLTGSTFTNFYAVDAPNRTITLDVDSGDVTGDIRPTYTLRLTGNAIPDQDLTVVSATPQAVTASVGAFVYITGWRTVIEVEEDITGIDTAGSVQVYEQLLDDGANAAHAIADLLFERWPMGLSLSQDDWDLDSLEDMGTDTLAEGMRTSWLAQDGAEARTRLGAGLQDMGYMLPIDSATGKLKFQPLREANGTPFNIDDDMVIATRPEIRKAFSEKPVDTMIFGFPDRENNFRDMTIGRMEDGQVAFLERAKARNVPLTIFTHFDSAAIGANRRMQEEAGQQSVWSLSTNRATRLLLPGQAVTADFTPEVLRVLEVKPVPDSNRVELKLMTDTYGIEAQDFDDNSPPTPDGVTPAQADLVFAMFEVPEFLDGVPPQTLLIPRIRAHDQVDEAVLHLSADGTTFVQVDTTTVHNPGGRLLTALSADGLFEPEDGDVTITALGPDIGNVVDYTGDDTNWRNGRQLALIISTAGVEVCYLKKVSVVSGSTYSLDGLIRARYGTKRLAHPVGGQVFVVDSDDVTPVQDSLLAPEVTRYAKTQPAGNGVVDLSIVPAAGLPLYGKGVRPEPVSAVRVTSPQLVNSYSSGDDVTVKWAYSTPRTPGTSAGLQGAGQAVGTTSPEGEFSVEILNLADTVVRTTSSATNSFTYDNADLQADLGSEVSFKIRITQLRDGFLSDAVTLTVEKV